jgi:ribonuclease HI
MIGNVPDPSKAAIIYTDGSCIRNPGGRGGWAYAAIGEGAMFSHNSGCLRSTTNNRMELWAIIEGLAAAHEKGYRHIIVVTDSEYSRTVIRKYEEWRDNYKLKGKKNIDLAQLFEFYLGPDIILQLNWVKGHAGDPWNEYVDKLALHAAKNGEKKVDVIYESLQR